MRRVSSRRIAEWFGVSRATYHRWRAAGLLPCLPSSRDEAREMRARIEVAWDKAVLGRPQGLPGRTRLETIAQQLGYGP